MRTIEYPGAAFDRWLGGLRRSTRRDRRVERTVAGIIRRVRRDGDRALVALVARHDGVRLKPSELFARATDVRRIARRADPAAVRALRNMARRIDAFHRPQKDAGHRLTFADGSVLEERVSPLESVGLYVPGGSGAYPSSVLMTAIPALIAGVRRIVVATPPGALEANPAVAAAIVMVGLEGSVLRAGGAQAIAALAYGTGSVPPVVRIVGPGNAFVAEAKRQVRGVVATDADAGPSEVVVIADASADPDLVALDLLAQAEHGSGDETVALVTNSRRLADAVRSVIDGRVRGDDRVVANRASTRRALRTNAAVVLTRSVRRSVEAANRIAAEHAQVLTRHARRVSRDVVAGAVFAGPHAPVAVGDYGVGPNHVLPTGGTARFAAPLSVRDFVRRSSFTFLTSRALRSVGRDVVAVADAEGFVAHAESVRRRIER